LKAVGQSSQTKEVLTFVGWALVALVTYLLVMEMVRRFQEKVRAGRILPFMPPPPPGKGPIIDVPVEVIPT
jgi:hypothetical protein